MIKRKKRKICIVISARPSYARVKSVLREIKKNKNLEKVFKNKKIGKVFFVKNRLINFLIT